MNKLKKLQVFFGVLIGTFTAIGSLYAAHKTFFLSDVMAQFDKVYVQKPELKAIEKDVDEIKIDVKEIRTDVKELLKND